MSAPRDDDEEDYTWEAGEVPGISAFDVRDPADVAESTLRALEKQNAAIQSELMLLQIHLHRIESILSMGTP